MAKNQKQSKGKSFTGIKSAGLVMLACFVIAVLIFKFIFGDPSHFEGGNPANHPIAGDLLGTIYKGGVIVPIIQTLLLTVLALSVERFFAIKSAQGKGKLVKFVEEIKANLSKGDLAAAKAICDKQQGSVANVVTSALTKYSEVEEDKSLSKEQQILSIQKEVEEATAL